MIWCHRFALESSSHSIELKRKRLNNSFGGSFDFEQREASARLKLVGRRDMENPEKFLSRLIKLSRSQLKKRQPARHHDTNQ